MNFFKIVPSLSVISKDLRTVVLNIIFGVYNRVCFDSQALKVFSSFIYSFLSVPTLSRDILSLKQFKKNIEIALKVFFTLNRTGPIFAKP